MRWACLGIACALAADCAEPVTGFTPVFSMSCSEPIGAADLAFVGNDAFLALSGGEPATSNLHEIRHTPLPLHNSSVWATLQTPDIFPVSLFVDQQSLYVCGLGLESVGTSSYHTLLRSDNVGQSFVPLDDGLEQSYTHRSTTYHQFLSCTQLIRAADGTLMVNAGGGRNLAVRPPGQPWQILYGQLVESTCTANAFAFQDGTVIFGGECPLDQAFLMTGRVQADWSGWLSEPVDVSAPPLENRNIQMVQYNPADGSYFVGVEGGLLRALPGQPFTFGHLYKPPLDYL